MMPSTSTGGSRLRPMPDFGAFYGALHDGREPFPWQARLAAQVAESDEWPDEVGIQTGLGKTACLDIAVWWLASQADRVPASRTAPTRIWWLVDRHLLADAATEHAVAMERALADPQEQGLGNEPTEVLTIVGERLRALGAGADACPLEVIRLLGGTPSRRPTDPSRPAVLLSTLPTYGSRLLFRGHGSTRTMRPIDAALAGTDSLVLIDEARSATHLRNLVPALAHCVPSARLVLGARSRPRVVVLTATGDDTVGSRFALDADDEAHPVVRERLDAVKPTEVRVITGPVAQRLVEAALGLVGTAPRPAACIVFANTVGVARATFGLVHARAGKTADVLLLTGRSREREAERMRARILDRERGMAAPATSGAREGRDRHLIVVATQALEVGADVDAEYLVTEACGVRALTQRLGRLNRLGLHADARAVYVHPPPSSTRGRADAEAGDRWPVYGGEPATVLQRLQDALTSGTTDTVNLSPRRIAGILGPPRDDSGRAPEVLPGLLWEWAKTTTLAAGEASVEPYFSGIAGSEGRVALVWRIHVPRAGESLWPRHAEREAVEVPIGEVREVLEDESLCRIGPDGVTVETVVAADLRPGDTIVLPSDRGLLDEFGWNPSFDGPVVDVTALEWGLPLSASALERCCRVSVGALVARALGDVADDGGEDPGELERAEVVEQLAAELAAASPPGWDAPEWSALVDDLDRHVVIGRNEVARLCRTSDAGRREPRSEYLDETSLAGTTVSLELHGQAVARHARLTAERLGIEATLVGVVERAGRLHDVGKADGRFQRWLDSDERHRGAPLAKSNAPVHRWAELRAAAGWPRGGRHEELSARLVRRVLERTGEVDGLLGDLLLPPDRQPSRKRPAPGAAGC